MGIMLGGDKAWKTNREGDIVRAYHWVNKEPAMVLYPFHKRTLHTGAFAICLSAAHQYLDVPYLVQKSLEAAQQLGMDTTKYTVHRIADAIMNGLEDLVRMPPYAPERFINDKAQKENVGEAIIKVDGKTIFNEEVTVPGGDDYQ